MAGELAFYTMAALFSIIVVGSNISIWRRNKQRQQLESKTPYDYALTNAINERDRLQDELRTIQALKRTEADAERIRNEIDTILSEDGERASEVVYGGLNGMPIRYNKDGTFSPITWDNRISSGEMADSAAKAFAKAYGTNVREDDTEDEQLPDNGVEYADLEAIDKAIHSEQKVLCDYRNNTGEGFSGNGLAVGTIVNFRYHNGQTRYLTLRVRHSNQGGTYIMHIRGEDLDEVSLLGGESHGEIIYRKEDDMNGETLYRKGNR